MRIKKMAYDKSIAAFEEAYKVIPGGVDSPVRAFKGVGGTPPFIERGEGMETGISIMCRAGDRLSLDMLMNR